MPTPIHEVILSPVVANSLVRAGIKTAEEAARLSPSELMAIKGVGAAAIVQVRSWQRAQEPPILEPPRASWPFTPAAYGVDAPLEQTFRAARFAPLAPAVQALVEEQQRPERIRQLAESLFREWVTIDRERNLPADFATLRREAYEAGEAFYPAPKAPSEPDPPPLAPDVVGIEDGVA